MLLRFHLVLLFLPSLLWIYSCKTIDYIHYLSQGKNLSQIQFLDGEDYVDIHTLDNIQLKGFSVSDYHHELVKRYIRSYQIKGDKTLDIILSRADFYLPLIKKIFKEKNIPEDLAYLPIIESGFNPKAKSRAGAVGLWQFMYGTGNMYGLKANYWYDDRRDFVKATIAAAYHLKFLYKKLDNWLLVLAAYNGGLARVSSTIKKYKNDNFWKLIEEDHLPEETKNYVPKFIASVMISKNYKNNKKGVTDIQGVPVSSDNLKIYELEDATDINILAQHMGVNVSSLKKLNPALKSWATPPSIKFPIYVPNHLYNNFVQSFSTIPIEERVTYRRYFVKIGDNLTTVSKKYGIPINPIAEINKFKSRHAIKAGTHIILPIRGLSRASTIDKEYHNKNKPRKEKLSNYNNVFLYLVQPQDTLYVIANRFHVSLQSLIELNQLTLETDNMIVREGSFLLIDSQTKR